MLGAEHLIHGTVAGHDTILRTGPHDNPAPGSVLRLGLKAGSAHWFEPSTRNAFHVCPRFWIAGPLLVLTGGDSQFGFVQSPYSASACPCNL